jgi:4-carboxymuconolactone decarboxylase
VEQAMTVRNERISMPEVALMTDEQQRVAKSLCRGPRKGVHGPFIALMQTPELLCLMEPLGAELRFHGRLEARIRELTICAVARHTSNQFEWTVHAALAVEAGVSEPTISALLEGRTSEVTLEDEHVALDFAHCLMRTHGVPDSLFEEAAQMFGDEGVVELTTLVGYFTTVCWIMNVARTTSPGDPVNELFDPHQIT